LCDDLTETSDSVTDKVDVVDSFPFLFPVFFNDFSPSQE